MIDEFGFNEDSDDFLAELFLESAKLDYADKESLDSFRDFVVSYEDNKEHPIIEKVLDVLIDKQDFERLSILTESSLLNPDLQIKALKLIVQTNQSVEKLITPENSSKAIVELLKSEREYKAFELIRDFKIQSLDLSLLTDDELQNLLTITITDFQFLDIFAVLVNSLTNPIEVFFDFIAKNEVTYSRYFLILNEDNFKQYKNQIKQELIKRLPFIKDNPTPSIYSKIIDVFAISFDFEDDFKLGYSCVENQNRSTLLFLSKKKYFNQNINNISKTLQACILFDNQALFKELINAYCDLFFNDKIHLDLKQTHENYLAFDKIGLFEFLFSKNKIYKSFFLDYVDLVKSREQHFHEYSFTSLLYHLVFVNNKPYLSLLLDKFNEFKLDYDKNFLLQTYYLRKDLVFIMPFVHNIKITSDSFTQILIAKDYDEEYLPFLIKHYHSQFDDPSSISLQLLYATKTGLDRGLINEERAKQVIGTTLTYFNNNNIQFIQKYGYSELATKLLFDNFKFTSPDIIRLILSKRANLKTALLLSISMKNEDLFLLCIANIKKQNVEIQKEIADMIALSLSFSDSKDMSFDFAALKVLFDEKIINKYNFSQECFKAISSEHNAYKGIIDPRYDFFQEKGLDKIPNSKEYPVYDETKKLFSQYNTRLDLMSYNNNVSHTQNSPQTTTKTEENFDFMRKNIKHEDKTLKQRMTETLLPLITFILLILAFSGISAFFGK